MTTLREGIELFASRSVTAGGIVEISLLKTRKGTCTGYFDDVGAAIAAVEQQEEVYEEGTYVSLNAVDPVLLARANNRLKQWSKNRTQDDQIIRRLWLALDLDARRPTGISASQEELDAALDRRNDVVAWLIDQGWPDAVYMSGGNGGHALFAVEEPNDDTTNKLFEAILKGLDAKFSDKVVNVDSSVHNPARIWTLPGTMKRKGDDFSSRPHRQAVIESKPSPLVLVTREQLEAVAVLLVPASTPKPRSVTKRVGTVLDMKAEFEARGWYLHDLANGKHAVRCPWVEEHSGESGPTQTVIFEPTEEGTVWGFNCKHSHCRERTIRDVWILVRPEEEPPFEEPEGGLTVNDFLYISPEDKYLCIPTNDLWSSATIDKRFPKDHPKAVPLSLLIARSNRVVDQIAWVPGREEIINNTVVSDGGVISRRGLRVANRYKPGLPMLGGDPYDIDPWLRHLVKVYPDTWEHIRNWFAHRVQCPAEKVNHALVLGGGQGIGKDTILEPLKVAIGPWNLKEVAPTTILNSVFNDYVQSIVLRISEARNLGDNNNGGRFELYERMKTLTTIPPETFRVNKKNIQEFYTLNVTGVIITTNHRDGLYIPPDDRRYHVSWCEDYRKEDFNPEYWNSIWSWYKAGGLTNVIAYLRDPEHLSEFDAMNPPSKTSAWHSMVGEGYSTEFSDLTDAIDALKHPEVLSLKDLRQVGGGALDRWLDRTDNRRRIRREMEEAGYELTRNVDAKDGYWKVTQQGRVALYARREMTEVERQHAVKRYRERQVDSK